MLDDFHFLLMRCFNRSNHAIVQRTATIGLLPGQSKILECLLEHDGSSSKEIGTMCAIDKSTMTSLLGKMERQNLVNRVAHPTDKRAVQIWLTEEGRSAGRRAADLCSEVDEMAFQQLNNDQQRQLMQLLQIVESSFEENA